MITLIKEVMNVVGCVEGIQKRRRAVGRGRSVLIQYLHMKFPKENHTSNVYTQAVSIISESAS